MPTHPNAATSPAGNYALMAADRARSMKSARRAVSAAAAAAMSSFRNAMVGVAVAGGIATAEAPTSPTDASPDPLEAPDPDGDMDTAGLSVQHTDSKASDRSSEDSLGAHLDPAAPFSGGAGDSPQDGSASLAADMVAQMALNDPDFAVDAFDLGGAGARSAGPSVRSSLDEPQEYRLSLEPALLETSGEPSLDGDFTVPSPVEHQARSSWNADMAKDLMKSRLLLGLPEAAAGTGAVEPHRLSNAGASSGGYASDSTGGGGKHDKDGGKGRGDAGDGDAGDGVDDTKVSVEGSISRRPPGVPPEPLKLLRLMVDLIQGLTMQLREECFRDTNKQHVGSPTTWVDTLSALAPRGSIPRGGVAELQHARVPSGGESFLLMHARWKKLEQDIYHPRRGRFDISKVHTLNPKP